MGDPRRALLGDVRVGAGARRCPYAHVADERHRRSGRTADRCTARASREPLLVADQQMLGACRRLGGRVADERGADDHDALSAEAQARERVPCPETALESGPGEFGRESALHVGAGPDAQEMEGDEFCGIPEPRRPLGREGAVHRGPHRAQDLVARAHPDRYPLGGDALRIQDDGIDDDRPVIAVQLAEDAALGQDLRISPIRPVRRSPQHYERLRVWTDENLASHGGSEIGCRPPAASDLFSADAAQGVEMMSSASVSVIQSPVAR